MITITIIIPIHYDTNLVGDAKTKACLHHHCVGRVRTEAGHLSIIVITMVVIIVTITSC